MTAPHEPPTLTHDTPTVVTEATSAAAVVPEACSMRGAASKRRRLLVAVLMASVGATVAVHVAPLLVVERTPEMMAVRPLTPAWLAASLRSAKARPWLLARMSAPLTGRL